MVDEHVHLARKHGSVSRRRRFGETKRRGGTPRGNSHLLVEDAAGDGERDGGGRRADALGEFVAFESLGGSDTLVALLRGVRGRLWEIVGKPGQRRAGACVVWWRRGKRRVAVRCDARDARKGGRETSRRRAPSRKGFPRTHRVQPDGGALVIDARDGARAPFAPSALPGVVLALAEHLHGQARPVNQESRAAAGDLGLGLVLALPRLGLLRRIREERCQISRTSRGRSTRAWRRVRRRTVPMEKERYSGESTAPRGRVREGEGGRA